MPTFLKNMKITFISLVKKGANNRKLICKTGEGDPVFELRALIRKAEADGSRIYSIVYPANEYDSQGDWSNAEEIEKAAYDFMKNLRLHNVDKSHNYEKEEAFVAESWIVRKGDPLFPSDPEGSWAVGIIIEDAELREAVKKGEIEAVSMGGTGDKAVGLEIEKIWDVTENSIRYRVRDPGAFQEGTFRTIAITKGIKMVVGKLKGGEGSMTAQSLVFDKGAYSPETAKKWVAEHKDRLKKSYDLDLIQMITASGISLEKVEEIQESSGESVIEKVRGYIKGLFGSDKSLEKGGDDMTKEEIQKLIDESINKAIAPLKESIEKSKPLTKEDVASAITESLKPIVERVEKVEKKTPGSAQGDTDLDDDKIKKQTEIGKEIAKMVNAKK